VGEVLQGTSNTKLWEIKYLLLLYLFLLYLNNDYGHYSLPERLGIRLILLVGFHIEKGYFCFMY